MSDTTENQQAPSSGLPGMTCSPSFDEAMCHLERIIHQHDDQPGQIDGYHADSLWLEEVRHHIHRLKRERDAALAAIRAIVPDSMTFNSSPRALDAARKLLPENAHVEARDQ